MVFVAGLLFAVVGGIALGQAPMAGVPLLIVAVVLGFLGGRELVRRWFSVRRAGWKRSTAWLTVFSVGGTSVRGDGGSGSASLGGSDSGGGGDSSGGGGGGSGS